MVRKESAVGKKTHGRESETSTVALRDEELSTVAGGFGMLFSAYGSAIKAIGEGLSTVARKG